MLYEVITHPMRAIEIPPVRLNPIVKQLSRHSKFQFQSEGSLYRNEYRNRKATAMTITSSGATKIINFSMLSYPFFGELPRTYLASNKNNRSRMISEGISTNSPAIKTVIKATAIVSLVKLS